MLRASGTASNMDTRLMTMIHILKLQVNAPFFQTAGNDVRVRSQQLIDLNSSPPMLL